MYDIANIKTLIETTGYTVKLSTAREPTLTELPDLPIIYVGYFDANLENSSSASFSAYEQAGENIIQSIETQICCEVTGFPVIWRKVYASLQGKSTRPPEEDFSAITYHKGGLMGIENTRLWWLDRWVIQFPAYNPFTF